MATSTYTRLTLAACLAALLSACGGSDDGPADSRAQAFQSAPPATYDVATAGTTNPLAPVTLVLDGFEESVVVTCELTYVVVTSPIGLKTIDSRIAVSRSSTDFGERRVQWDVEPRPANEELRRTETVTFTFRGLPAGSHTFGLNFIPLSQAGWSHADAIQGTQTTVQVNRP